MPESEGANNQYLIVGLGNPGREYRGNRHNVGFMTLDRLAQHLGASFSRVESRALVTKSNYRDDKLVLAKPQTFMNRSGQAVAALARFYKIPGENILVVYDDVDLPFGVLRLRPEGSSGGQKGIASVIESLSTQSFPRLRIGIDQPPGRMDTAAYVLQDFGKNQAEELPAILDQAVQAVLTFVEEGIQAAMNKFNGTVEV